MKLIELVNHLAKRRRFDSNYRYVVARYIINVVGINQTAGNRLREIRDTRRCCFDVDLSLREYRIYLLVRKDSSHLRNVHPFLFIYLIT